MVWLLCTKGNHYIFTLLNSGVTTLRDQFTVGQSAIARCFSNAPATRMEWLTNGVVVESAASTQQLNLVFPLVNDSIHHQVYTCRVIRVVDGMTATQNFTVNVDGKMVLLKCIDSCYMDLGSNVSYEFAH